MDDPNPPTVNEVMFSHRQVTDIVVGLAVGAALMVVSYRILQPFIQVIVAGGVIAIAVYPLFLRTVDRLGGRSKLVVALFAVVGVGLIVVPVVVASSSLFDSAHDLSDQVKDGALELPSPPPRVRDWPLIGTRVHAFWLQAATNLQTFVNTYHDQMRGLVGQAVSAVAGAGVHALQFIFTILIAAVFLANAEACAAGLGLFSKRLFGETRGPDLNQLAVKTLRSVATGVLGVAFIQAVLAGLGMAVAGVPWVGVWTLAILLLAIMQLPPIVILLPVALWVLGSVDNPVVAWGFVVWALLVSFSDAVLKPMLLGRGVEVPMIVILLGAIGGMMLTGIIGLFLGAVVLALAYRLVVEWLEHVPEESPAPSPDVARDTL